jgi:hypothetical protein
MMHKKEVIKINNGCNSLWFIIFLLNGKLRREAAMIIPNIEPTPKKKIYFSPFAMVLV